MSSESVEDLAFRYRQGLQAIYELVSKSTKCQCLFVPNWMSLLDQGHEGNSPALRADGIVCLFCSVEHEYSNAIGNDVFNEQVAVRFMSLLHERYDDPVAIRVIDDDGNEDMLIVERYVADEFLDEDDYE